MLIAVLGNVGLEWGVVSISSSRTDRRVHFYQTLAYDYLCTLELLCTALMIATS